MMGAVTELAMPLLPSPPLPVVFQGDLKLYLRPGLRMPSVTTVLGATEDRSGLEKWIAKVGLKEAERIRDYSAARGTKIHRWMEDHLLRGLEPSTGLLEGSGGDPDLEFWYGLRPEVERLSDLHLVEGAVWANTEHGPYAGTVDLCCRLDGGPLRIVDLKTKRKPLPRQWCGEHFTQLAMYAMAVNNTHPGLDVRHGAILSIDEKTLKPVTHLLDEEEMELFQLTALDRVRRYYAGL